MTDYIELLLEEHYDIDTVYYQCKEAAIENEAEFLLSCFENNLIPVYEEGRLSNLWERLKNAIRKIFNMFVKNFEDKMEKDNDFINNSMPLLDELNYDGLSVAYIPYWLTTEKPNTMNIAKMCSTGAKPTEEQLEKLTDEDEISKHGEFAKITLPNMNFAEAAKLKYLFGTNATSVPNAVTVEGAKLESLVKNTFKPFVINAKDNYKNLKKPMDVLIKNLDAIEQQGEKAVKDDVAAKEAYSFLEGAMFKDTDLKYCINASVVFEAKQKEKDKKDNGTQSALASDNNKSENVGQQTSEIKKDEDVGKVEDNRTDEEKAKDEETPESKYDQYYKTAATLAQKAIAAEIYAFETTYTAYVEWMRNILITRKPKDAAGNVGKVEEKTKSERAKDAIEKKRSF